MWNLILAGGLLLCGSSLAAAGGIGGGAIYVSILTLVAGIEPSISSALSSSLIFANMVAAFMINIASPHPTSPHLPLIAFDVALLLMPPMLAGTVGGVYLNLVSPDWLTTLTLVCVLSYSAFRTITKGVRTYRQEKAPPGSAAAVSPPRQDESQQHTCCSRIGGFKKEIMALLCIWVLFSAVSILKGGKSATVPSIVGVLPCSLTYWVLVVLLVPICVGGGALGLALQNSKLASSRETGEPLATPSTPLRPPNAGTLSHLASSKLVLLMFAMFVCGVLAAFMGIGGGMILGPILLELHLPPRVVTATSAFVVLFSSAATFIQFLVCNQIPLEFAGSYMPVTFLGAVVGLNLVSSYVKRTGKTALVIFCLAAVIVASILSIGVSGGVRFVDDLLHDPGDLNFRTFC